jgi:hypothetical protein
VCVIQSLRGHEIDSQSMSMLPTANSPGTTLNVAADSHKTGPGSPAIFASETKVNLVGSCSFEHGFLRIANQSKELYSQKLASTKVS